MDIEGRMSRNKQWARLSLQWDSTTIDLEDEKLNHTNFTSYHTPAAFADRIVTCEQAIEATESSDHSPYSLNEFSSRMRREGEYPRIFDEYRRRQLFDDGYNGPPSMIYQQNNPPAPTPSTAAPTANEESSQPAANLIRPDSVEMINGYIDVMYDPIIEYAAAVKKVPKPQRYQSEDVINSSHNISDLSYDDSSDSGKAQSADSGHVENDSNIVNLHSAEQHHSRDEECNGSRLKDFVAEDSEDVSQNGNVHFSSSDFSSVCHSHTEFCGQRFCACPTTSEDDSSDSSTDTADGQYECSVGSNASCDIQIHGQDNCLAKQTQSQDDDDYVCQCSDDDEDAHDVVDEAQSQVKGNDHSSTGINAVKSLDETYSIDTDDSHYASYIENKYVKNCIVVERGPPVTQILEEKCQCGHHMERTTRRFEIITTPVKSEPRAGPSTTVDHNTSQQSSIYLEPRSSPDSSVASLEDAHRNTYKRILNGVLSPVRRADLSDDEELLTTAEAFEALEKLANEIQQGITERNEESKAQEKKPAISLDDLGYLPNSDSSSDEYDDFVMGASYVDTSDDIKHNRSSPPEVLPVNNEANKDNRRRVGFLEKSSDSDASFLRAEFLAQADEIRSFESRQYSYIDYSSIFGKSAGFGDSKFISEQDKRRNNLIRISAGVIMRGFTSLRSKFKYRKGNAQQRPDSPIVKDNLDTLSFDFRNLLKKKKAAKFDDIEEKRVCIDEEEIRNEMEVRRRRANISAVHAILKDKGLWCKCRQRRSTVPGDLKAVVEKSQEVKYCDFCKKRFF